MNSGLQRQTRSLSMMTDVDVTPVIDRKMYQCFHKVPKRPLSLKPFNKKWELLFPGQLFSTSMSTSHSLTETGKEQLYCGNEKQDSPG